MAKAHKAKNKGLLPAFLLDPDEEIDIDQFIEKLIIQLRTVEASRNENKYMKKQYQKKFDASAAKNLALINRIQTLKERYQARDEFNSEIEDEEGAEAG